MKIRLLALAALLSTLALSARAADLTGTWNATFDSQIGQQKYSYTFTETDHAVSGRATYENQFGQGTVDLQAVKVDGDKVTFSEPLSMGGNEITITYEGTIAGDELKLTRHVGDFATEEIVAKRPPAQK
jgi:hypothetical protein